MSVIEEEKEHSCGSFADHNFEISQSLHSKAKIIKKKNLPN